MKPKYLYSYTIKNTMEIKQSERELSEQAGMGGKSLHLGCPVIPHPTPDPLHVAFQVLLYPSPTTYTVGLKRGRCLGRKE